MKHVHRGKSSESILDKDTILRAVDLAPRATVEVGEYFYMQIFENA